MKKVRGDGGSLERAGELVGIEMDEADEGVVSGSEETVSDEIVLGGLHDNCFRSGYGLFAESCVHEVS